MFKNPIRCVTFLTGFALMTAMTTGASSADSGELLLSEEFNRPNGLITNEYAYWNPDEPDAVTSLFWELDSGSFFAEGRAGWTGVPDDVTPNATSTNGTNSAVFRLSTKRADFTNVTVSFSLLNQGLSSSPSTPPVDWDGLHIWLRYQNEYNLYYASINRRDNTVVVKKKVPGGSSNGGTYYQLSSSVRYVVPYNMWQEVTATVNDNKDGSVTIRLYSGKNMLVEATDGYRALFAWAELDSTFMDKSAYVVTKRDGKALSDKDGPFQLVTPGEKRGGRWVRQVAALRIRQAN